MNQSIEGDQRDTVSSMSSVDRISSRLTLVLCLLVSQESAAIAGLAADRKTIHGRHLQQSCVTVQALTVDGKSNDKDLGAHIVGPGQKSPVTSSVKSTTVLFCKVSLKGGLVKFDIYNN